MHLRTLRSVVVRLALAGVLLVVWATPAAAQNVVVNGSFDEDLEGWGISIAPGRDAFWSSVDLIGAPSSGSAVTTNSAPSTQTAAPISQCIPIEGGVEHRFGAHILIPGAQLNGGEAWMSLIYFPEPGCKFSQIGSVSSPSVKTVDHAVPVEMVDLAPAIANSAFVSLSFTKVKAEVPLSVTVDEVFVIAEGEEEDDEEADCVPGPTTLCIDDQPGDKRFRVAATFDTVLGGGASGQADVVPLAPLGVSQGGLITFFSPTNPELLVKILSACPVNDHYWVFYAATTNVGFEIAVTDTVSGRLWSRTNPDETFAVPVLDTAAFPCD